MQGLTLNDIASVHCRAGGAPLADVASGFNSSRRVAAGSDCVGAGWIQRKVRPLKFLQLQAPSKLLLRVRLDQRPPTRHRQLQPRAELETGRAGRSARGNRDSTCFPVFHASGPALVVDMPLFRAGWQASPAAAVSSAPPSTAVGAAASHAPHVDALAHIDLVVYAGYEIRAQYPSPYPLEELPGATPTPAPAHAPASTLTGGAATPTRENGGRFGGEKVAPTVPITNNNDNNSDGKEPNGSKAPTPPPRGSTGTEAAAGREISPELAAPATTPVPTPMQIDPASTALDGGESAAASVAPQRVAAPERVAVAETPTPSPLETIPPAPLPPPPPPPFSADATTGCSNAPSIASTSALAYSTQPTPPVATSRGSRGRFLPKPPGETVKAKRAAERAARLAAGKDASSPNGEGYLTQRQQRELARKAREERERELREKQKLLPPTEVKLFVCDRCFKYMALPAAYLAHQVRSLPGAFEQSLSGFSPLTNSPTLCRRNVRLPSPRAGECIRGVRRASGRLTALKPRCVFRNPDHLSSRGCALISSSPALLPEPVLIRQALHRAQVHVLRRECTESDCAPKQGPPELKFRYPGRAGRELYVLPPHRGDGEARVGARILLQGALSFQRQSECPVQIAKRAKTCAKSSCRKRSRTTITTSLALSCFRRSGSGDGPLF